MQEIPMKVKVECADGPCGEFGAATGHITHLVLLEGHLWGKKEVTLPVSAIACNRPAEMEAIKYRRQSEC